MASKNPHHGQRRPREQSSNIRSHNNNNDAPPTISARTGPSNAAAAATSFTADSATSLPSQVAKEVYEIQGDATSALNILSKDEPASITDEYNRVLLCHLVASTATKTTTKATTQKATTKTTINKVTTVDGLLKQIEEWEKEFHSDKTKERYPTMSNRKRNRNIWIAAYNRALIYLSLGKTNECIDICYEKLKTMIVIKNNTKAPSASSDNKTKTATTAANNNNKTIKNNNKKKSSKGNNDEINNNNNNKILKKPSEELALVASRVGFLFLEGILYYQSVANPSGLQYNFEYYIDNNKKDLLITPYDVIQWLDLQQQDWDQRSSNNHGKPSNTINNTGTSTTDITLSSDATGTTAPNSNHTSNMTNTSVTTTGNNSNINNNAIDDNNNDAAQFKFLLALYKSRLDFSERKNGKHVESKIRSARKELKLAMEVFQHKLRPISMGGGPTPGSISATTSAAVNENSLLSPSWDLHSDIQQQQQQNQQQQYPIVLQEQNQTALNLKAHLEQLKGNAKKSLILCSESLASTPEDPFYEAIHDNNLALVYVTNRKKHLALHSMAKALRRRNNLLLKKEGSSEVSSSSSKSLLNNFRPNGTVRPDPTLIMLYNSALCSLQARNFLAAYECLATCVQHSANFSRRPRCWLRMAEGCIGIHAKEKESSGNTSFSTVEIDGEPKGILLRNGFTSERVESPILTLASPEDLDQVQRNPLIRARHCLEITLILMDPDFSNAGNDERNINDDANEDENKDNDDMVDEDCLASARLAMAYVCLEFRDYRRALEMSKLVLESSSHSDHNTNNSSFSSVVSSNHSTSQQHYVDNNGDGADGDNDDEDGILRDRMALRRIATARLYAAEASCALADVDTMESMRFLIGDGQDDAFDRLASDLCGGVTIEVAANNRLGKGRLAKAQALARSSASVVSAVLGHTSAAKQLAMSAQAMEDASISSSPAYNPAAGVGGTGAGGIASSGFASASLGTTTATSAAAAATSTSSICARERSTARRALIFCMLREGNGGLALNLLRSLY